jgi:signal transduction histidine kinase
MARQAAGIRRLAIQRARDLRLIQTSRTRVHYCDCSSSNWWTMKILIVDDNASSRQAKSRTLQYAGFTVFEAASGAQALGLVAAEAPDLVLLDVQLPDMSGYEVCRRIKHEPATASIMVVQMSASFVAGQESVRGLDGGADAYLTAPVHPEEFIATVQAMLRLRQTENELHQTRNDLEARVQERTAELERAIRVLRREVVRRKQSEKALLASQQFLQSTLDALSSHIVILDETGAVVDMNASWQSFVDAGEAALLSRGCGMDFGEFFSIITGSRAASGQTVIAGVREVVMHQRDTFFCEYASSHSAELQWFFVRVTRFDSAEGGRIVVLLENITEIKHAEETLRHQQETLYQSEKLAAMGALLASVAHELNNPLAVMQMQLDLLGEESQDSALQERVTEVREATERCIRIVQSFLTLARRTTPQRTPVQLNAVVEAALQLLSHALHLDNVLVQQHLDANLPLIGADAAQLQQVVVNLLLNAQQAFHNSPAMSTPRQITLTTRFDTAQKRVVLEIADTGPGIPPQLQERIFEPFFTTKPVGVGTGLGLSVCRGIIEGHGGTISVVSQPGRGAAFRIELPAESVSVLEHHQPEASSPATTITGSILIVDDEVGIARGLARLLRRDGHYVDTANDGRQALAMLQVQAYDLILCDLRMPGLDGPGLYRAVATQQPHLLSHFVFLTGDTLSQDAKEFLAQAGVPRLTKPFSAAEGRRMVWQILSTLR